MYGPSRSNASPWFSNRLLAHLPQLLMSGLLVCPAAASAQSPSDRPASDSTRETPTMNIKTTSFGSTPDGEAVRLFTCTNHHGAVLKLTDYGAIMVAIEVPDREQHLANVTLGFDQLEGYLQRHPFFGATVGRYANRIARGQFTLDGKSYSLATNDGANHLHGGQRGFDRFVWQAEPIQTETEVGVKFTRLSPAGEGGYPGNVEVAAVYTLNDTNELKIEFTATADAPTPINLANHAYWNLAGRGDILQHQMLIDADQYAAVDATLIPTGQLLPVQGTPLDFTHATAIGARIEQLKPMPGGYDHCYVLRSQDGSLRRAARVVDPASGRVMEVWTTQPGIQFYSGNFLDGSVANGGNTQHAAFCLETQHYPDSPNQPSFPGTILRPGQTLHEVTVHRFSTQ